METYFYFKRKLLDTHTHTCASNSFLSCFSFNIFLRHLCLCSIFFHIKLRRSPKEQSLFLSSHIRSDKVLWFLMDSLGHSSVIKRKQNNKNQLSVVRNDVSPLKRKDLLRFVKQSMVFKFFSFGFFCRFFILLGASLIVENTTFIV